MSEARARAATEPLEPLPRAEALWVFEGLWRANVVALRMFAQRLEMRQGMPLSEWDDQQLHEAILDRIKRGDLALFSAGGGGIEPTTQPENRAAAPLARRTQLPKLVNSVVPAGLRAVPVAARSFLAPAAPTAESLSSPGPLLSVAVAGGVTAQTLRGANALPVASPSADAASKLTFFEVQFVDEIREPIVGLKVTFHVDGSDVPGVTRGDGVARLDNVTATSCRVEVDSVNQLRILVKDRWDRVRSGKRLTNSDGVEVRPLQDKFGDVQLINEKRRTISVQPKVVLARLFGLLFDTSKNFLLPTALATIQQLRDFYDQHPISTLLIVGHTDTAGRPAYNDVLSLERAESMRAFLTNDVEAWLARFSDGVAAEKRWGEVEQTLMLDSVLIQPAYTGIGPGEDPVLFFQRRHNELVRNGNQDLAGGDDSNETSDPSDTEILAEDGKLGSRSRRALVRAYMRHDRTTLPAGITLTTHGCGENFPLDATGTALDAAPPDASHEQEDRRVELFFFDRKLGIQPKPLGKNSKPGGQEYPEWRLRAAVIKDLDAAGPVLLRKLEIRLINNRDEPLANTKYRLTVGTQIFDDVTDAAGTLRQLISADAKSGLLSLDIWSVELTIAPLDDSAASHKARLNNLGLSAGDDGDGTMTDRATRAIERFQVLHKLNAPGVAPSGILDAPTKTKLREQHGG
jgi:outer membrane protein OmpA-like peptidoglycan-associated protein